MAHWGFTFFFIFSLLVILRNMTMLVRKLYDAEPTAYKLPYLEALLLGLSIAYGLTYIIH
jgi:uncharacterized membrane protein YhaH (DUF805 family)